MCTEPTQRLIREGLVKGCLGGLGLTVIFLAISAATFLLLDESGLQRTFVLIISIISGPVIGTGGLLLFLYRRSSQRLKSLARKEVDSNSND
jgi:hypothetical protein